MASICSDAGHAREFEIRPHPLSHSLGPDARQRARSPSLPGSKTAGTVQPMLAEQPFQPHQHASRQVLATHAVSTGIAPTRMKHPPLTRSVDFNDRSTDADNSPFSLTTVHPAMNGKIFQRVSFRIRQPNPIQANLPLVHPRNTMHAKCPRMVRYIRMRPLTRNAVVFSHVRTFWSGLTAALPLFCRFVDTDFGSVLSFARSDPSIYTCWRRIAQKGVNINLRVCA